jgi:hypothetical protein
MLINLQQYIKLYYFYNLSYLKELIIIISCIIIKNKGLI